MEIEFFVTVPSATAGERIALSANNLGFDTSVDSDDETGSWTCYCAKVMLPTHSDITKAELELDKIAKPFAGYVDGFGSFGNAK